MIVAKRRKFIYLSLLVAVGLVLHFFENAIPVPFPVPGAKLGLANVIALIALTTYGTKESVFVSILRCILGALFAGSISSFLYSLSGAIASTIAMAITYKYFKNIFSLIGVSIIGGVMHNIAQITVASLVVSNFGVFVYLPILMVIGLFTGSFIGLVAYFVNKNLNVVMTQIKISDEEY